MTTDAAAWPKRLVRWVAQIEAASLAYQVDCYLLAAIMDRESLGGERLIPEGPGGLGDEGHGHGLFQIDDRSHSSFLRATFDDQSSLWADPAFSALYAARLIRKHLDHFQGYPCAIAAYNAGAGRVTAVVGHPLFRPELEIAALDRATTGHNYVSDVLRRRDVLAGGRPLEGVR